MNKTFEPDYNNILAVLHNNKPERIPLYEHHIDAPFISKSIDKEIVLNGNKASDYEEYYKQITSFWKCMTYDAFDFEAAICDIFPGHGAILGGITGPIQNRDDFEKYPFDDIPKNLLGNIFSPS